MHHTPAVRKRTSGAYAVTVRETLTMMNRKSHILQAVACCGALLLGWANASGMEWSLNPSLTARESYDSNVFLEHDGRLANRESFVTTLSPSAFLTGKDDDGWVKAAKLGYTADITFFHQEPSEDNVTQIGSASYSAKSDRWMFETTNSIVHIDGDDEGPRYSDPHGPPAMGALQARDRRDATIYRSSTRVQYTQGDWFFRPNITAYVHDFHTQHKALAGYMNYVDRYDINGGVDVGRKVLKDTYAVIGYRYGHQHQDELMTSPIHYDNTYHRVLFGIEGKPAKWLRTHVLLGPDYREYGDDIVPGADQEDIKLFVDATVGITLSPKDELLLVARQFELVAFTGRSVYQDMTYQASWRHTFSTSLATNLLARAYGGDWEAPAVRVDWIYTVGLMLEYKFNNKFSVEIGWAYDWAESNVPHTSGRDFDRHVVSAQVKYAF